MFFAGSGSGRLVTDCVFQISSSLAAFGGYIHPMTYSNEIGLHMLIGWVVLEASAQGYIMLLLCFHIILMST